MKLQLSLVFLLLVVPCFSGCISKSTPPTTLKREPKNEATPELTIKESIANVVRKGNQVTFDYTAIASEGDLATKSHVIANCKTQLYRTTYWAVTKKGIPIMENDKEPNKIRTPNADMRKAVQEACEKAK